MRNPRRRRIRSAVLAATLVATLAATLGPTAESASAATGTAQIFLAGNVGDGGPATEALVDAYAMRREGGDLLVADATGVRRVVAQTGGMEHVWWPTGTPYNDDRRRFDGAWLFPDVAYFLTTSDGERRLVRSDRIHQPDTVLRESLDVRVLDVLPDGSIVLSRGVGTEGAETTEVRSPDGSTRQLVPYASDAADAAADGTIFLVPHNSTGSIERVLPDGSVEGVAGPGATDRPRLLAVSAAGDRVAYADAAVEGGELVRSFAVGGRREMIARNACPEAVAALLLEDDDLLVACGGIRSYALDGSQALGGTVVAGLNDAPGVVDSPSGTPMDRAFLSRVLDVAVDARTGRIALATRQGAYVVSESGAVPTLVQVLSTGEPARPVRHSDAGPGGVDVAYDGAGRLYLFHPDANDDRRWRVQVHDGRNAREITGSGTGQFNGGDADVRDIALRAGHIEPSRDGSVLYVSQDDRVLAVDLATGAVDRFAGGVVGTYADERYSDRGPLRTVSWLGTDPVTGDLLISDGSVHRVDSQGWQRTVNGMTGTDYAATPDGALYSVAQDGTLIWRSTGNVHAAAVGRAPWWPANVSQAVNGLVVDRPVIAPLPDNRLVVAEPTAPTAVVRLLKLPSTPWAGAAPTMTVRGALVNGVGRVNVQITSTGASEFSWAMVSTEANRVSPTQGSRVAQTAGCCLGPAATGFLSDLPPGQRLYASLFAWNGDGSAAPTAVIVPVTIPGPPVTLAASAPTALTYGSVAKVTGRLTKPDGRTGIAGESLTLQMRRRGTSTWTKVGSATTAADGVARIDIEPSWSADFRWVHEVSRAAAAVTGSMATTTVTPKLTASVTSRLQRGHSVVAAGTLKPAGKGRSVYLQRYSSGKWKTVVTASTTSPGNYRITSKQTTAGTFKFRAYSPATTDYASAKSPTRTVTVTK